MTAQAHPARPGARMVSDLFARGALAGGFAGLVFIVANMVYATAQGKPAVAPFLAISTVFHFSDAPVANPNEVVVGLVTHFGLAALFGVIFAFAVPILRNASELVIAALAYGLLLYLVNFQILGRILFDFFQSPAGLNQVYELIVHPLAYGLPLVPFLLGWTEGIGRGQTPAGQARFPPGAGTRTGSGEGQPARR